MLCDDYRRFNDIIVPIGIRGTLSSRFNITFIRDNILFFSKDQSRTNSLPYFSRTSCVPKTAIITPCGLHLQNSTLHNSAQSFQRFTHSVRKDLTFCKVRSNDIVTSSDNQTKRLRVKEFKNPFLKNV